MFIHPLPEPESDLAHFIRHLKIRASLALSSLQELPQSLRYRKSSRLIFITALPKSGSTWLAQMLSGLEGFRPLRLGWSAGISTLKHRFDPRIIDEVPLFGRYYVKLHVEADQDGIEAMRRKGMKGVVLVRDPRDQTVSRYHHVLAQESHRHHALYKSLSMEEGLAHCCEVVALEYLPWIKNWLTAVRQDPEHFILLRYEEMKTDPKGCLDRVLRHNNIVLDDAQLEALIQGASADRVKNLDLSEKLKIGSTFRKGMIGEWRDVFTEKHVSILRQDTDELLTQIGIEPEWTLNSAGR